MQDDDEHQVDDRPSAEGQVAIGLPASTDREVTRILALSLCGSLGREGERSEWRGGPVPSRDRCISTMM